MGRAGQEWTRRNTARSINHLHQPRLSLVMASGGGELVQARGRDPIDQSAGRASASRHEDKRGLEMPGRCSEAPGVRRRPIHDRPGSAGRKHECFQPSRVMLTYTN